MSSPCLNLLLLSSYFLISPYYLVSLPLSLVHYQKNGGKCGVCGDDYRKREPREHEAGGMYGNGIVTKRYVVGQVSRKAMLPVCVCGGGYGSGEVVVFFVSFVGGEGYYVLLELWLS